MKQKAKRNLSNKFFMEKKNVDNFIVFKNISNKLMISNKDNNKKDNISKNITKPKHQNKKKVKYDPIIFRMIQSHNKKKWNSNMVICVSIFLNFEENLYIRLVCKLFNEGIQKRYEFLKENIVFSMDKKIHEKIRKEYLINNKNNSIFDGLGEENNEKENENKSKRDSLSLLFNKNETGNFSKKQILISMINNKDYISIKYRVKKRELFVPHYLSV